MHSNSRRALHSNLVGLSLMTDSLTLPCPSRGPGLLKQVLVSLRCTQLLCSKLEFVP
jgi:hypothetical protein